MPATAPATTSPSSTQRGRAEMIERCLRAATQGRRVFIRRPMHGEDTGGDGYVRVIADHRLREGLLADTEAPVLMQLIDGHDGGGGEQAPAGWPGPIPPRGTMIFLELAEPMAPFPEALVHTDRQVDSTPLRYFGRNGRLWGTGTLTREVVVEGFEDVHCPAGTFADCLRVRVTLTARFPLTPVVDWTSLVWLSPTAGEVRRTEVFSGWFLVFWFASQTVYELSGYDVPAVGMAGDLRVPCWARAAVVFDRTFPRPRIAGLMVDLDDARPPPHDDRQSP